MFAWLFSLDSRRQIGNTIWERLSHSNSTSLEVGRPFSDEYRGREGLMHPRRNDHSPLALFFPWISTPSDRPTGPRRFCRTEQELAFCRFHFAVRIGKHEHHSWKGTSETGTGNLLLNQRLRSLFLGSAFFRKPGGKGIFCVDSSATLSCPREQWFASTGVTEALVEKRDRLVAFPSK